MKNITKHNIKLIYLTFVHCMCKFEKHENYEQTFPNKKHKQSNVHEKHKQFFRGENYNRTFHNKSIKIVPCSIYVRCSILILLTKTVLCSIRSL